MKEDTTARSQKSQAIKCQACTTYQKCQELDRLNRG